MDSIITKTTSLVQYVVKKVKATTCCSKGVVFILLNVLKIGKLFTSAPYALNDIEQWSIRSLNTYS